MNAIKVLLCGNSNIYRGMLLTVLSIVRYSKEEIEFYIGTMDLSGTDERYTPIDETMRAELEHILKSANKSSRAILIDFTESFRHELINSKNLSTSYTPYAMIRLFADEIEGVGDKLLYLDSDVMFLGDIRKIYDINIEKYHLAGARDFFGKFFFSPRYINSGVLLLNMKKLAEDGVLKKCRKLCNDKKMLLFDQHAINKFARRKLILKRRFNEQHKTRKDTLIRHFSMTIKFFPYFHTETVKPWQPELVRSKLGDQNFDDIFKEYEKFNDIYRKKW